jgi:hypothetical protein
MLRHVLAVSLLVAFSIAMIAIAEDAPSPPVPIAVRDADRAYECAPAAPMSRYASTSSRCAR